MLQGYVYIYTWMKNPAIPKIIHGTLILYSAWKNYLLVCATNLSLSDLLHLDLWKQRVF